MECFTVLANEMQGRLDVESNYKRVNSSDDFLTFEKFKVVKFGEIAQLKRGPFGGSIKKEIFVEDSPKNYQVYEQYNAIKNNPNRARYFISENDFQRLKSFSVQKNDILMSCSGTIGKLVIIPEKFRKGVINQALLRIRLNENINLKYFLVIFRYIIEKLIEGNEFAYGSAIRNIVSVKELKEIRVPLPPLEIQNKIVSLMDKAYSSKKSKETESQKLLDSINDYVLDELKIKFTDIEEEKIYIVNSKELENTRTDPYYFNPKFDKILSTLEKNKIDLVSLKEVSEKISNGKTPPKDDYSDEGNLILKVNCLRNNKVLWQKLSCFKDGVPAVKTIKDKDILLLSSAHQGEYLGRNPCIAEIPENLKDKEVYFVGEIISISVNPKKINPYYLLAILKLKEYYLLVNREKRGQTSHLYPNDVGSVKIPLPPLSVQNKIADEVKRRMQKAETLQKEAKEELEKAKLEVEKIILG